MRSRLVNKALEKCEHTCFIHIPRVPIPHSFMKRKITSNQRANQMQSDRQMTLEDSRDFILASKLISFLAGATSAEASGSLPPPNAVCASTLSQPCVLSLFELRKL